MGGGSVLLVIIEDAKTAVIYHFVVALNIGGSARTDNLFGVIGVVVGF